MYWPGYFSRYSDSLRAGLSEDRIPVGARFSAPVQTGPESHLASNTMSNGSFPGEKRPGRGVNHPPHLAPRLNKSTAISLLRLWAFVACYKVNFTFTFTFTDAIIIGKRLLNSVGKEGPRATFSTINPTCKTQGLNPAT